MTANFLALAKIAETPPFQKVMRLKKFESAVSFKLPMALAAFLIAILSLLLPLGIFYGLANENFAIAQSKKSLLLIIVFVS